jgi:uncharacterized protein (DUF433 family)
MKKNHSTSCLLGVGIYTPQEAAAYTHIPSRDIQRWLFGYRANGVQHSALWEPELLGIAENTLSFHDLLEIRFVHAFRRHGVSLQAIRSASRQAKELFGNAYPFTQRRFQTDGKRIFATILHETGDESLLDLVKKQYAFEQIIKPSLYEGIEYAEEDSAQRWYPVQASRAIVLDPARNFGKPVLAEEGVDTAAIAQAYEAEEKNAERVAQLYEIPLSTVHAAVEFEHRIAA